MGYRIRGFGLALVLCVVLGSPVSLLSGGSPSSAHALSGAPASVRPAAEQASPLGTPGAAAPAPLTLTPSSGVITQSVTVQLSASLLATTHQWTGYYFLWDGAQILFDGGGSPPGSVSFYPNELELHGGTRAVSPGRHTVGLYDTVVRDGTMEPHMRVATAAFTITAPATGQDTGPDIGALDIPARVQGGTKMTVTLLTDPRAEIELIVRIPGAKGGVAPYVVDVTSPVDSSYGAYSLSVLLPPTGKTPVDATVTVIARIGSGVTQRVRRITLTPDAVQPAGTV